MPEIHNLDESIVESFEFIVKGYKYKFRQPNTEELEELAKLGSDEKKSQEFLFSFISKVDESSPEFPEVAKKMIAPHWVAFRKMIQSELGG
jgi:hypothetical protein